jgi:Mitochondrial inner membrane protein
MTEFATSAAPPRGGMRFKHILLLAIIAFGGGIGASWWLADNYGWFGSEAPLASAAPAPKATASLAPAAPLVAPLTPSAVDSAVAAVNPARAEGLLVAIAARRAIDNGTPLGYLTDQLRLRFGSSQPQAVITVLQASQAPITLAALQSELTAIENLLVTGTREETLWATIRREFSELFVLRKSDSPSPAPTQRMLRTHAFVESGNIAGAIAEISAMPGAATPAVQNWLRHARSYEQTRKALDTLERSALAAPPILVAPPAPMETPPMPETQQIIVPE